MFKAKCNICFDPKIGLDPLFETWIFFEQFFSKYDWSVFMSKYDLSIFMSKFFIITNQTETLVSSFEWLALTTFVERCDTFPREV